MLACSHCGRACKVTKMGYTRPHKEREVKFERASGDTLCYCGKPYRLHRHSVHLSYDGQPWLRAVV